MKKRESFLSDPWFFVAATALFWPTSLGAGISLTLAGLGYAICGCALLASLVTQPRPPYLLLATIAALYGMLWGYYFVNPEATTVTDGAVLTRSVMCLFLLSRLRGAHLSGVHFIAVLEFLFAIQLAAFGLDLPWITTPFAVAYDYYWDGLVAHMLSMRKPVGTFALHSVAAFASFLLLYVRSERYALFGRTKDLLMCGFQLIVLVALASYTSLVLSALGAILFFIRARMALRIGLIVLGVAFLFLEYERASDWVRAITSATYSGPQSRFAPDTPVYETLVHIQSDRFSPVGFGFIDGVFYGDSGAVELLLRTGWMGLLIAYAAFVAFVLRNSQNTRDAAIVAATTLAFEIGHSALKDIRTFGILTVVLVALNQARRFRAATDKLERVLETGARRGKDRFHDAPA